MKRIIGNPKIHDTSKLQTLSNVMGSKYNELDPRFQYLNKMMGKIALENYQKKNTEELQHVYAAYLAAHYSGMTIECGAKGDEKNALAYADKGIDIYRKEKLYYHMYSSMVGKAVYLSKINRSQEAIKILFSALDYFEKNREEYTDGIPYVLSTIASIYSDQNNETKAAEYFKKSIAFYEESQSLNENDQFSLCVLYSNLGTSLSALKQYESANAYFEKALSLSRKLGDDATSSIILSKLGQVQMNLSHLDKAEALLKESLQGNLDDQASSNAFVTLGELYVAKKDFRQADQVLSDALDIARRIKNLALMEQSSKLLLKVSRENKDFKKALRMYEFHDSLTDSGKMEAAKNEMAQRQLKYDFEKKELQYKLVSQKRNAVKNNWLIALSGALLLLALGGIFYYRNSRQKQAIALLEKGQIRQKLLISQMNPHFIFNSIENIRSLIRSGQNDQSVDYLSKFSRLTRQILEYSNENYISLTEEVEMIENYLSIQQLLYENKFTFLTVVDEHIDPETILLPPMLTQPFIENAIKHGLSSLTGGGRVEVRFFLEDSRLFFEVTDNGKGFGDQKPVSDHKSMAMSITKERLAWYMKKDDFHVKTENLTQDGVIAGARVRFEIPYIYEN